MDELPLKLPDSSASHPGPKYDVFMILDPYDLTIQVQEILKKKGTYNLILIIGGALCSWLTLRDFSKTAAKTIHIRDDF